MHAQQQHSWPAANRMYDPGTNSSNPPSSELQWPYPCCCCSDLLQPPTTPNVHPGTAQSTHHDKGYPTCQQHNSDMHADTAVNKNRQASGTRAPVPNLKLQAQQQCTVTSNIIICTAGTTKMPVVAHNNPRSSQAAQQAPNMLSAPPAPARLLLGMLAGATPPFPLACCDSSRQVSQANVHNVQVAHDKFLHNRSGHGSTA